MAPSVLDSTQGVYMLPPVLIVLAVIALVLYLVFEYFIPQPYAGWPWKPVIALVLIVLVLIFWFVLPLRVG